MTTPQEAAKIIIDEVLQKPCPDAAAQRKRLIDAGLKGVRAPHLTRWVRWALFNVMVRALANDKKGQRND